MNKSQINFRNINLLLFFLLPIVFLFFGLKKQGELHEKLMIQGIGIDFLDNRYKVTVQAYDFKNPEKENEPKIKLIKSEGETISGALQNLKNMTGLSPLYSQNKIIIIGEDTSKLGVKNIIDFFVRFYENRPSVKVRVSQGKAEEIFNTQVDGKFIKASEIKDLVDEKFDVNILEFEKNLESSISSPSLFFIQKKDGALICENLSIFKKDKFIKTISNEETLGVNLLKGNQNIGVYSFKDGNDLISFKIQNVKAKINPKINEGTIDFKINIKISADLIETSKVFDNTEKMISNCKNILDKNLKELCEHAIQSIISEECDTFKFKKMVRNKYPQFYKDNKFESFLKKANYDVRVDSKIAMIGIESK